MWQRVDTRSPKPLFAQIVDGVKDAVARGELEGGAKLPSVRGLAQRLSVNPNTVVKAYGELEAAGLIVRRQGAGCFVAELPNPLAADVREGRLAELTERLATEAFHLGFGPEAVRAALERALGALAFDGGSARAGAEGEREEGTTR